MGLAKELEQASLLKEIARLAASDCAEQSLRLVTAEVFFCMPDHPHVLSSMPWQFEDRFEAGDAIVSDYTKYSIAFADVAKDVTQAFQNTVASYQNTTRKAWGHVERMARTSEHFELPFRDYYGNPTMQQKIIDELPFPRTRQFLNFWLREIDGPLHTVAITHTQPRLERPRLYGVTSRVMN